MAVYFRIFASAADTTVQTGSGTNYASLRALTTATSLSATTVDVGQQFVTPNYNIGQYFGVFDFSTIPVGNASVILSLNATFNGGGSADFLEVRECFAKTNRIAGDSLSGFTLYSTLAVPTATGRFRFVFSDTTALSRTSGLILLVHSRNERLNVAPTLADITRISTADSTGTTNDPYIDVVAPGGWQFLGVSNVVEVTATPHALVTTSITGLAAGDLLVACISSRIASTTSITLPTGGEWTLVSEQKTNNTLTTTSAAASGMMAYCVRGASNPNLTFTHPVAPSVALGRIVAYRNVAATSPLDAQTSFTTASTTAVSGTGLTTTQIEDLIVACTCGGQEAAWSAFNATDPVGASGATSTAAPTTTWLERADSLTTTGADTSLAIFDAVKVTSGATGNLTATADMAALHVVIAGAFKIAGPAGATGTGTPAGQAGAAGGAGVSGSDGAGTSTGQAAAVSGTGTVGSAAATGTGALAAQSATAAGAGVSASSGSGALAAQAATASGAGVSASVATGALLAQVAAIAGTGAVASVGIGALAAQSSTVAGAGLSVSTGSGALQAAAAAVVGAGTSASTGTGSLVAGSAEVAGTGTAAAANSGVLVAQAATVAGLGVSSSTGSGALQAGASAIAGAGLVASVGTGALIAGPATVAGEGVVIAAGAVVGSGALVAGAATLSGAGEVTGEVAPPVSVGGGYWRPYRQPVAVEGVGYAILPELEGEAHGLVVAAGAGDVKGLPLAGTSVGTVAVVGRSAARLTVRVEAVGERGLAGEARAVLKGLSVAGAGAGGANCTGARAIIELQGAAIGRHDDDEAAIMAWLLAA